MNRLISILSIALAVLFCLPLAAQKKNAKSSNTTPSTSAASNTFDETLFKGLRWRNIGPFRGGRSNAVAGVVQNDNIYYTGYTGGGLWKTEDAGLTWRNISDGFFKTSTVGDIAVAESDPNVIYVGMGEHAIRGVMTTFGDGVYKSTDAGKTWKHIGLDKTRHVSDVVVHPNNPDIVYVAAQGAAHGPNEERGIYKSTDGGQNWKKVLYVDVNTGASSLSMDYNNPRILYAATWQHRRHPWQVESGGPGCSLWKSVDSGETWTKISKGLPDKMGKMGISVSKANSNRVYAIVEAEKSKAGLYRSDDGGMSWSMFSNNQEITSRSWYYMEVFADPQNADIVYVLNAPMMRSIDGGKTFSRVNVGHGDTHDLWINPGNNQNMILGDDGGGEISFNGGRSWSTLNNQPTAQFYRVNTDNLFPYRVYGGQQDNTSVVIASRNNGFGITAKDWFEGPGCECAYIAFDPNNPEVMLGGCYQGQIDQLDTRTMEMKSVMEYPSINLAIEPKNMKYRFNWNAPIVSSPHDPKVIYHAGNVLFRTRDGGMNWEVISPDLTRNDPEHQGLGGAPLTNEGAGGENYNTIYYVIESSLEKGVIYTGSDCGLVHVTRDEGKSWQNITPAGLPECSIHSIEVSPHDKGTVYISANRYKFNDFSAMSYKSTDYGRTWTKISSGIEADDFLRVMREDRKTPGILYGGGERGFYISFNGGAQWHKLQLNLPVVPVTDLAIQDNDLVASTQGRSFWILDDLGVLQQSKGQWGSADAQLFQPKKTVRFSGFMPPWITEMPPGLGQNPLSGVILDYYLSEKADTNEVKLEIFNSKGELVRMFTNKKDESFKPYPGGPPPATTIPAEKGLNRFAWDFRTAEMPGVPGVYVYGDYRGRQVAPGSYRAKLTYKGQSTETPVEIVTDPRLKVSDADWTAQQQMLTELENQVAEMHQSVSIMRKIKKQIAAYNELLGAKEAQKTLVDAGKALIAKIDAWEAKVVETRQQNFQDVINWPSKINAEVLSLRSVIDVHDPRITQGARQRAADLRAEWEGLRTEMSQIKTADINAYNQLFKQSNVPALIAD